MLVDSHCHLDFPDLADKLPHVLAAMKENGVGVALCIGVNLEDLSRVLTLAETYEHLYATVGVHPEYTDAEEPDVDQLLRIAAHPRIVAIGETGLDYYWQKERPEWQRQRFRVHIRAARACGKPLVIHMREAADDTLKLLQEESAADPGGVMHCFTENWDVARRALDLGLYLSFSGIVTFRNAESIREVARRAPLDRILVETDAPYLAPAPYRGKPNQPAYVKYVAEEIARQRGLAFEELAQATTDNFFRLFRHAQRPTTP